MRGLAILSLIGLISGLCSCATVAGVGKDVSAVGQGITHIADEVRDEVFLHRGAQTQHIMYREPAQPVIRVKELCDPHPELAGGEGLPACPAKRYYR